MERRDGVTTNATPEVAPPTLRRVVAAAGIGTFVEYFDYSIYGLLAAYIGFVFFPSEDPAVSLLATFAVFAIPVIVRPLGGFFFSHFGDRAGRQRILAIVIILMSGATLAIGLLPGYATIGILAPILLVTARAVQGFSAGGEYAGGASFMAEYSPNARRGFITSWMASSTGAGVLVGSLFAFLLTSNLSEEAMNSWGWRVPFLLAAPLGLIGLYIRLKLEDTPMFQALEDRGEVAQAPLAEALRVYYKQILLAAGILLGQIVAYYAILIYTPTYLSVQLGFERSESLLSTSITVATYVALIPVFAIISDRLGRKPLMIAGCAGVAALMYPGFLLMSGAGLLTVVLVQAMLGGVLLALYTGPLVAALVELFPTRVRYSGYATGFNAAAVVATLVPFLSVYLIAVTGSNYMPAYLVIVACLVSLVAIFLTKEMANQPLPQVQTADHRLPRAEVEQGRT